MEKSVYLVWHLGNVVYVGSTMNLLERRAGHISQAYGTSKVAGLVDYMREVFNSGGRNKKFEFAFQELYRGTEWESIEEKTMTEMKEKFPDFLLNRSTMANGNNSTYYKRIPPKVTREQIEKSINTRRTTDCMKTAKVMESIRNAGRKRMCPVLVDGVEFESAKAAATFLNTSNQTVMRTANGTNTAFSGRIQFKKKGDI